MLCVLVAKTRVSYQASEDKTKTIKVIEDNEYQPSEKVKNKENFSHSELGIENVP